MWEQLLRPDHVVDLMDDTGIIQHANGAIPAWNTGYCVDDVARMVVVGCQLHRRAPSAVSRRMVVVGLAFMADAVGWYEFNGGPGMHNFMAHDRRWLEPEHVGDHVGRAVWAMGEVVAAWPQEWAIQGQAWRLLHQMLPVVARFDSLHEWAYGALGLSRTLDAKCKGQGRDELTAALAGCVDALEQRWQQHAEPGWPWPHPELIYDNARIPQAALAAGATLGRPELVERARLALDWLTGLSVDAQGVVHTVGNHWLRRGEQPGTFTGDEQPIDVAALCEAHTEAARVLGDQAHAHRAVQVLDWFGGNNRLGVPVYDVVSAGCHDGLGREAVNDNQGAESTLAFLQAALCVASTGLQPPRGLHVRPESVDRRQFQ